MIIHSCLLFRVQMDENCVLSMQKLGRILKKAMQAIGKDIPYDIGVRVMQKCLSKHKFLDNNFLFK